MNFKTRILLMSIIWIFICWLSKVMASCSPLGRIRLFTTKAYKLIYVQAWVVFGANSVDSLECKHDSTVMAGIMLNAFMNVDWELAIWNHNYSRSKGYSIVGCSIFNFCLSMLRKIAWIMLIFWWIRSL